MAGDWYAETFGECPHGYIKPYCGQCASDESDQRKAERQDKRNRKRDRQRLEAQAREGYGDGRGRP
jgi:hypothetical protein